SDDNLSASSSMEVDDRLSYLEQRVQLQEDEIQLLKAALADVLRRLSSYEEQSQGFGKRGGPTKVRQILQALPSKPFCNGYLPQKRMGGYPSSPSSPKKEMVLSGKSKTKEPVFSADDGYVKMFLRGRPITMHLPDGLKGSYSLETKAQLPEQKLKLQWVYPFHRNSTANRKAPPVKCFDLRKL
ncbi:Echinoderm microtubule-associated protein-like 1, partial [Acipenser ruthenus]